MVFPDVGNPATARFMEGLSAYRSGRIRWLTLMYELSAPPEADFAISTRLRHPDWYAPDGRIFRYGDAGNQLGDYFLKLASVGNPDKPLRGFGIHGTGDDATVGRNWSNGCVRMHNRDVELLYYLVPSGTPVRIVPGAGETGKAEKRDE